MSAHPKPAQDNSSHFITSTARPLQFFPPQDGVGVSQFLILSLTQDAVQFPTDHSDHPPSTTQGQMS